MVYPSIRTKWVCNQGGDFEITVISELSEQNLDEYGHKKRSGDIIYVYSHNNKVGKCSKPGADFANQTVAFAIKPSIKGFYAEGVSIPAQYNYPPPFDSSYANGIDDFVAYEGTWELPSPPIVRSKKSSL